MYITMCLYITITILLWVLSTYPFIKHYTIVVSIKTIQFKSYINVSRNRQCEHDHQNMTNKSNNVKSYMGITLKC